MGANWREDFDHTAVRGSTDVPTQRKAGPWCAEEDTPMDAADEAASTPGQARAYLDAASTEPLHPAARTVLLAATDEGWADPARLYAEARRAGLMLDNARAVVAECLGARPEEVVFTTSGTQAIHLGVLGITAGRRRVGRHVVHSAVEHTAVLQAAEHAVHGDQRQVSSAPVDRYGRVDADELVSAVRPDTALVCLQAANHEVGTLQPVAEVAELLSAAGRRGEAGAVPLLVDAAQTVGRLPPPDGWSALAASAHKWGGPAGVGVLAIRRGTRYRSPLPADQRHHAARSPATVPGFDNVPGVLAAAAALVARTEEADDLDARHRTWVAEMRERIPALVPDTEVIGHPEERLAHLVTFSCLYVDGEALLGELDRAGVAVSSGSSCAAGAVEPSHVLAAMGVLTHGNVRVSLGRSSSEADVQHLLDVLPGAVQRVRAMLGATRLGGPGVSRA